MPPNPSAPKPILRNILSSPQVYGDPVVPPNTPKSVNFPGDDSPNIKNTMVLESNLGQYSKENIFKSNRSKDRPQTAQAEAHRELNLRE